MSGPSRRAGTTSSEQPATAGQRPNGNRTGAAGKRRDGHSYNGLPVRCLARRVGDKSAGLAGDVTHFAVSLVEGESVEGGGALVAQWLVAGGDLRRPLLRGLGGAAADLSERCASKVQGDRPGVPARREGSPMEARTFKLVLLDGAGETVGEWRVTGCGSKLRKQVEWAVSLAVIGVNAEYIEILRAVAGLPSRHPGAPGGTAGRVGPNAQNPSQSGGLRARDPHNGAKPEVSAKSAPTRARPSKRSEAWRGSSAHW